MKTSRIAILAARFAVFDGPEVKLADTPVKDGKLVYLVNGKEELIDPAEVFSARSRITALNGEAQGHRTRAEAAEAAYAPFRAAGITDAAAAKEALDLAKSIKQGDLLKVGEVEKVREEIGKSFQTQLDAERQTVAQLKGTVRQQRLDTLFNTSKYINEKLAIPVDIAATTFGRLIDIDDNGKVTAKDASGNVIYSRDPAKSGVHAEFEEAIGIIVDGYQHKDKILKGNGNSGSGNDGGGGKPGGTGGKMMKRSEFDAKSPQEKADMAPKLAAREIVITPD